MVRIFTLRQKSFFAVKKKLVFETPFFVLYYVRGYKGGSFGKKKVHRSRTGKKIQHVPPNFKVIACICGK